MPDSMPDPVDGGAALLKNGRREYWIAFDGETVCDPVKVAKIPRKEFPWEKFKTMAYLLDPDPPAPKVEAAKKIEYPWLTRPVEPLSKTPSPFGKEEVELDESAAALSERAVYLSVAFSVFGDHRKADKGAIKTTANKAMLTFGKHIIESPEYDAITSADNAFKSRFLRKRVLPSPFGNKGIYVLPRTVLNETEQRLRDYYAYRQGLVKAFLAVYPEIPAAMAGPLGDHYNVNDYPSVSEMAQEFEMKWRVFVIGLPVAKGEITKEYLEDERRKFAADANQVIEDARSVLTFEMSKFVNHIVERLTPDADGKTKTFRGTLTENISEFLAVFNDRNIGNDPNLAKLATRASSLLKGVDATALRDSDTLRTKVADGFTTIKARLDGMVATRPGRQISVDDDE